MALVFPLSLAAFADRLGISQVRWSLQDNREFSGLGSGQILEADLAPSLWSGDVSLREWHHPDARWIEAKVNAVIRAKGSFYLYDPRHCRPASDPDGSILGARTVLINSLPDAKSMSLKGLPAAYRLKAGDYLSFDYGAPDRRAFHEIAEDVTANASGVTPAFEVNPVIRPGAAVDLVVTLIKPAMRCKIVPGSFNAASSGNLITSQLGFSVMQRL